MTSRKLLNAAVGSAFALTGMTGAMAGADNNQSVSASSGVPVIVLMPVAVATAADFSNGCWARLYDSTDFRGDRLSLVGPIDMPNMRTAFGKDWSGDFDSIQTGPNTTMTVYDAENYRDRAATFGPHKAVRDLDEKMGAFEQIRSVKLACAGTADKAQANRDNSSGYTASANFESFSSLDKNNDGMLGRIEAAADADAKSHFERLDSNHDQKLSRSEYEAWDKVSTTAVR